jgi:hypothetical protein
MTAKSLFLTLLAVASSFGLQIPLTAQAAGQNDPNESSMQEPKRTPLSGDPGVLESSFQDSDFYEGLGPHGDGAIGQARAKAAAKKTPCVYKPVMTDDEIQNCRTAAPAKSARRN